MDQQDITQAKAPASRLPSLRPPAGLPARLRRAGILYPFLILFIALIGNGFDLLGLNPLYEQIALGGILLIAVGLDAWSRLRQN